MAAYKYLIFFALAALIAFVAAEEPSSDEAARVKKHAFIAAPAPVVAYTAPAAYPYAYSAYPYAGYPAVSAYSAYAAYPSYPAYGYDDGKYWPGKYDKTYYPAPAVYKSAAYPIAYHY